MALSYDVTENKNAYREISKEEYENNSNKISIFQCPKFTENGKYYEMNSETNMLILLCGISIGIPNITEKNYEVVFNRISILEELNGTFMVQYNPKTKKADPKPFTLDMVKNNIGIKTNGIEMSISEFKKKLLEQTLKDREI